MKEFDVNVDIKKSIPYTGITVVQGDSNSNKFNIDAYDNALPYPFTGLAPKIFFKKTDGTVVIQDTTNGVTIVDASTGKLSVVLATQTITAAGMVQAEIAFYGTEGEKLTSAVFQFYVRAALDNGNAIESSNELTALTNALTQVNAWDAQFESKYTGLEAEYATELTSVVSSLNDIVNGYNLKNGLIAYRAALADVERNPIIISILGTSVTYGVGSSDLVKTNYVSRIRKELQTKYGNVGIGNYFLPAYQSEASLTPWWTFTGTWSSSGAGLGGRCLYANGSGTTATLVFTGIEVDVVFSKTTNGSANGVTVVIDGVTKTPPNFSTGGLTTRGNIIKYTGLSAGEHTMVITADPTTGKYCWLEDTIVYNPVATSDKGIYIFNFGTPGSKTGNFTDSVANLIIDTNSHLVIVELGINDAFSSTDVIFLNELTTIVSTIKANPKTSVLLLSMYDFDSTIVVLDRMSLIRQHIYDVAKQYNCGVLDVYGKRGTHEEALALGLCATSGVSGNEGTDTIHPSDKGHRWLANTILDVL